MRFAVLSDHSAYDQHFHGRIWMLAQFTYSLCGVSLDESKKYLVETRLSGLLSETGSTTYAQLYSKARSDVSNRLQARDRRRHYNQRDDVFQGRFALRIAPAQDHPDLITRRPTSAAIRCR